MATKVYLSGDIVFVEKTANPVVQIPQNRCESLFLGILTTTPVPSDFTNVTISDNVLPVSVNDLITNIQNSGGTPIGDFNAVRAYLAGFIFSSSAQLVDGNLLPTGGATAANQVLEKIAIEALTKPTDSQYSSCLSLLEEIQTTGLFRTKTAYAFNLIGLRNGFTSTSILQGVKEYDNGVADFAITSNSTLDIISSNANDTAAGTGVRTVKVVYINNSGALVESPSISLNGTTLVTSVLTGVQQVLWMEAATVGSTGSSVGNIRLRINGGTVEVEQITAGGNKSRSAIFQVPTGYTGYIANWRASAVNNDQDCRLLATVNTLDRSLNVGVYNIVSQKYAAANTSIPANDIWMKIPALGRVKVSTISGGTNATIRCNTNILVIIIQN